MDEKHFHQLVRWLENNIDTSGGTPLIFDDEWQLKLEKELNNGRL